MLFSHAKMYTRIPTTFLSGSPAPRLARAVQALLPARWRLRMPTGQTWELYDGPVITDALATGNSLACYRRN